MRTKLKFRDITDRLLEGFEDVKQYDIVRNVLLDGKKEQWRYRGISEVYSFHEPGYNMEGLVFPMDEVISLKRRCDIIIRDCRAHEGMLNVNAYIYHQFYENETLTVRVSRISERGDPSFKLFNNITGFIKRWGEREELYDHIHEGSIVVVAVDHVAKSKDEKRSHVFFKPSRILT